MKAVINTMLITLAAVAFVLLFAALAALVGERAATLAHGGRDNLLRRAEYRQQLRQGHAPRRERHARTRRGRPQRHTRLDYPSRQLN